MTNIITVKVTGDNEAAVSHVLEDIRRLYWPHVGTTSEILESDRGGFHAFLKIKREDD